MIDVSIPAIGRRAATLLAALAFAAPLSAMAADPVPQNVLDTTHSSCMQGCASAGKPQDKCTAYCGCMVDSIEEDFSGPDYVEVNKSMVAGKPLADQPIPEPSKSKLIDIVTSCGQKAAIK
ncbi:MAG TPA: hypothetical protein VMT54_03715 [Candidatus Cybelea sp.]|nr:hypothetical protein [Candidatus Cybelea sp.]